MCAKRLYGIPFFSHWPRTWRCVYEWTLSNRPGAYNGATIEPVLPTLLKFQELLLSKEGVDLVLPMTHQSISDDRAMAAVLKDIPVVCGGVSLHSNV